MTLYTRPQLAVLLLVVIVAGAGLGIGHWRRSHPEIAARLESFDLLAEPPSASSTARDASVAGAARPAGTAGSEPADARFGAAAGSGSPLAAPRPGSAGSAAWSTPERSSGPPRRPPKSAPPAQPLDVNRATEDELRTLPGIGGVLAARIVETRERDGPFASLDDLRRVPGLGRTKLERIAGVVALPR
jgi:competence protein ComEA